MFKNNFIKLSILFIILVSLVSLSLIGCKEESTVSTDEELVEKVSEEGKEAKGEITAPESKVTLDLWFQDWTGGKSWQEAWVAEFEKNNPTIDINLILMPFEELNTKMFPAIAAGNEADLLFYYDEWLLGKDPAKISGAITPDLYNMEEIGEVMFESALTRITGSDGEIYGAALGTGANAAGILLHRDIFDEAGIDPASLETWDDVKDAAKELTSYNDDGSIERSGILFTYTETANLFLDVIAAQGAADKVLNNETGEWNFNIPEAKNSLELLKWFVDEKVFDPQSGDPFTSFPNKLGAMLLIGPWAVGAWGDQYPDLELDYIYMPKYPGTDKNVHTVVSWFCIAPSKRLEGEKRDAALIYIRQMLENPEFFNIPFNNGYWVGVPGSVSYIEEVTKLVKEGNAPSKEAEIAASVASQYVPSLDLLPTKVTEPELIRAVIYPELQNLFLGDKTVEEVLDYLTTTLTTKEQENR